MQVNPNEAQNGQASPQDGQPRTNAELLAAFAALNDCKKGMVWMYFLHLHTNGCMGANLEMRGSVTHFRCSAHFYDNLTKGQFRYQVRQVAPLAVEFHTGTFYCFLTGLLEGDLPVAEVV
jgi:hypothetical protein